MINNFLHFKENHGIIKYDGENVEVIYSKSSDSRFESMEYMIKKGFNNISTEDKQKIEPFEITLNLSNDIFDYDNNHYSIIGMQKSDRILPTWSFDHLALFDIEDYDETCERIEKNGQDKFLYDKILWTGKLNSPAAKLFVLKFCDDQVFNINIMHLDWGKKLEYDELKIPEKYITPENYPKYKYLLDLEGEGGRSTRLKFLMFSSRAIFMQERTAKEYWMWDLIPFVHYIPVKKDLSDLKEKISWAENNQKECEKIAQNALSFARSNLKRENAINKISKTLLNINPINTKAKRMNILCPIHFKYGADDVKKIFILQEHSKQFLNLQKIIFLATNPKPLGDFIHGNTEWKHLTFPRQFSLHNIYHLLETQMDSEWVLLVNNNNKIYFDKIYNSIDGLDYNENVIITSEKPSNISTTSKSLMRHLNIYDKNFNLNSLSNDLPETTNLILSKGLIRNIKNYKYINNLILFLESFAFKDANQIIFLLSLILKSTHHKLDFYANHNFSKDFEKNVYGNMGILRVNDWPAGVIFLDKTHNSVLMYDHPNESKFEMDHEKIIFYGRNKIKTSILKKINDKIYEGNPINENDNINKSVTLKLELLA